MLDLKSLIEKRNKAIADMRALIDAAPEGVLTPEMEEKYNKFDEEQERLDGVINREVKIRNIENKLEEPVTKKVASNASASVERDNEKEVELRTKLFRNYLIYGETALHRDEFRALAAGALTEGGSFIPPQQFIADLIKAVDDKVYMLGLSTVYRLQGAQSLGQPVLDADPADADWTTELETGNEDSTMATGLRELKPLPIAKLVKVSRKLISNSAIPVENLVQERLAYKFAITMEKGFLTGNGATAPLGVFTASTSGIPTSRDVSTGNTDTEITFDGLIEALFSLKEGYQAVATWMFHRLAVKMIRKLKDGEGRYLWQPSVTAGQPNTILDRPYVQSEYAPSTFTTGLYAGIIGDFRQYHIAEVTGTMEIQRLMELYAATNQVGYIGRLEADGMPVLGEAFARVKLA